MTKSRGRLTELEGAILGVIRREPHLSAYAVRQVFLVSSSAEWSGSAGAVYPALNRMTAARFVAARAKTDRRGTRTYLLTKTGTTAHDAWLCDVERATGPGLDPFRTRAGLWLQLAPAARRALMKALRAEASKRRDKLLRGATPGDPADAISQELVLALLETRIKWLDLNRGQFPLERLESNAEFASGAPSRQTPVRAVGSRPIQD